MLMHRRCLLLFAVRSIQRPMSVLAARANCRAATQNSLSSNARAGASDVDETTRRRSSVSCASFSCAPSRVAASMLSTPYHAGTLFRQIILIQRIVSNADVGKVGAGRWNLFSKGR